MRTVEELLNLKELDLMFRGYPYIAAAYLFGSQAAGRTGPMSDVDFAVLLKDPHPEGRHLMHQLDHLAIAIEDLLKKEVDVIAMNRQGLIFQHNVLRTGRLIYDADPVFRTGYVSRLISSYCDFEPTIRFMDKYYFEGYKKRLEKV